MYTCFNDVIMFHWYFNSELTGNIKTKISKYKKLIFANTDKLDFYIKNKHNNDFDYSKQFGSKFNNPIDNKLPKNIICLILGWSFNQPVDNLPMSLIEITFGHDFNHPVDNLPFSLVSIAFGFKFNKSISNLPNTIKEIVMGSEFNQPIDDLPNGLEKITLGKCFTCGINNLPNSLKILVFKSNYCDDTKRLPNNLELVSMIHNNYYIQNYNKDNIKFKFINVVFL